NSIPVKVNKNQIGDDWGNQFDKIFARPDTLTVMDSYSSEASLEDLYEDKNVLEQMLK
ncbi:unnamed protein product, partial [Brachionus calyciflorus]